MFGNRQFEQAHHGANSTAGLAGYDKRKERITMFRTGKMSSALPGRARRLVSAALALGLFLALIGAAAQPRGAHAAVAASEFDWRIVVQPGASTTIYPYRSYGNTTRYGLFNRTNGRTLGYGSREYGINLVWQTNPYPQNITFYRAPGSSYVGALRYCELIALHVKDGGFLRYGSRDYGINLVWSATQSYEWQVLGGTCGQPVTGWANVSLYNTTNSSAIVHYPRLYGISLDWWKRIVSFRDAR